MNIEKELQNYLYDNKIGYDDIYSVPVDEYIVVLDGDWKHDHIRCDKLIQEFCNENNLTLVDKSMNVIDDDGSDCYVAEHFYKIVDKI